MTTYYIDAANGDNVNSGSSLSDPWADFGPIDTSNGSVDLQAGDVVKVRGGTYPSSTAVRLQGLPGQESNRIVVEAYQDEVPTLDFTQNSGQGVDLSNSQYTTFRGFEVMHADTHNVRAHGSSCVNVVVEDCEIHGHGAGDSFGAGISCALGVDRFTVRGCEVYDGVSGGNSDGIRAADNIANTVIEDCLIHHNSDDGIDLKGSSDGGSNPDQPALLRRVVCYRNGRDLSGSIVGDGNGFKMGDLDKSTGGHRLEQCVAFENETRGIGNPGIDIGVEVINCTAYNNGSQNLYLSSGGVHRIVNTLGKGGGGWDLKIGSEAEVVTCNWNSSESGNFNADPVDFRSVDVSSPDFLRLPDGSPYIDAGTDVSIPYNGSAPDLGAFETSTDSSSSAVLKYYDGSSWVRPTDVGWHDGGSFGTYRVKMWDGNTWQTVFDGT
ncbi:right-handed parallel beta-helix repeat-containing protein [Salinirubellus salinus]|uniref:Right-handed parallel beta-helix repeat-containing protein n=1 Tax=Salinirubellus salinus TaxID=1364945 RepID=A0A9E7R492_9EURY|nr:right-handed parallel beta-helix repeat-containing protein [Salinirubellus salinus]UWM54385.1 right-handed parallel beta-helix repeat-containing protein [Salinirubellus salinus]